MLFVILLCFLGLLLSGLVSGLLVLLLLLVLMMLLSGLTLLVFWLSGFLFLRVSTGLLVVMILGSVVFLMWSCSSCMSFGLGRDWFLEKAHPRYLRPGRPIFSVCCSFWFRRLIFGAPVALLVP